ncbi:MAG TPA: hypothetical protein VMF66_09735 [Candidatus Acidoferrum sp.]|nr:hypothetical protein [Candidatus Acidoferrum sp.]
MKPQTAVKRFESGTFRGVPVSDAFAVAALQQEPVVVKLGPIPWPAGLAPSPAPLGSYNPGTKITSALQVKADALLVLYTDLETSALLDVFTGDNEWSPSRAGTWCGYGHNFAKFRPSIENIGDDAALKAGMFGYISAAKIGTKAVVLYKTELHPKQNGSKLPFVGVMQQLIQEIEPSLVISTGTAGAIGNKLNCGDVAITSRARFKVRDQYPGYSDIDQMSANGTELTDSVPIDPQYLQYAAANLTKLSLPGLSECYTKLQKLPGYAFVHKNTQAPAIYATNENPVPGAQAMDIVSADYLTVDNTQDSEKLQPLGVMNDTDDAFLFYAIDKLTGKKPHWLSVRNASEPQIATSPFPAGTPQQSIVTKLGDIAGKIYGIYQYCTTLNSAFACWGILAGM